ncbi:Non-photochemical quenching 1 isoform 1 [Hibiscus syriacus]|uniref:Non-photochemical quenching 1 isoform 1 n=1 Tax=Hibiscus syriacus TaxID=106335 RepID=A0A6A2X6S2_HIBSY|nr:Non-photochemical quenching 1 isoform 1 [Hibiscus syriacus]
MAVIRELLSKLQESNEESKSLHKPESLKALRNKINNDIVTVQKKARTIKSQLKEMDRVPMRPISASRGQRRHIGLQDQDRRHEWLAQQVKGADDGFSGFEAENDGRWWRGVLTRAVQEHGRGKVMETAVEIEDRHTASKEKEKSLLELHQEFLDMAVIVEAQGEQMDDIEHHVMNVSHYVKDGAKELNSAKQHQSSSRKCMCIGIILLLLIVLLIIVPIATSYSSS